MTPAVGSKAEEVAARLLRLTRGDRELALIEARSLRRRALRDHRKGIVSDRPAALFALVIELLQDITIN
jgi:hypothetical protein